MSVEPIFLLSQPRSGSTLMQRVLGNHSQIATLQEPWILLPLLSILPPTNHYTRTRLGSPEDLLAQRVARFAEGLPAGYDDYRLELRELALRLYSKAAPDGASYFLDKSPSYFIIADEILRVFPDSKVIFLWRNPLAVLASVLEKWAGGRWDPGPHQSSLLSALAHLVEVFERHGDRVLAARYEDLVSGQDAWRRVLAYLELSFEPEALPRFTEVGPVDGPYSALSTEPLNKWRDTVDNPVRAAWCRRYLARIGRRRLELMGYEPDTLLTDLSRIGWRNPSRAGQDASRLALAAARRVARARMPAGPQSHLSARRL